MRLACQLLDALAEFALFRFLERDRPKRPVRVELIPLGLGHGARANEGQREPVERLAPKVALSSRIGGDIAQQLSERRLGLREEKEIRMLRGSFFIHKHEYSWYDTWDGRM
jgi:hypothetical protein